MQTSIQKGRRNKYQDVLVGSFKFCCCFQSTKSDQVVTKQTKWSPEASVVILDVKNSEKNPNSKRLETEISEYFKQTKVKTVIHRVSEKKIMEVGDKTNAEMIVTFWQPYLFGRSQC